ncbi:MAG: SDR family NAD(P)-dependent oxidoreductase, partial [Acidobacteria bacterium]
MTDFPGKVVFVTGGSRGLGAAIARRLAAPDAVVVINYVERDEAAAAVAREIEAAGGRSEE